MKCTDCNGNMTPDADLQSWKCSNAPLCHHRDYRITCPYLEELDTLALRRTLEQSDRSNLHAIVCISCGKVTRVIGEADKCLDCRNRERRSAAARIKTRLSPPKGIGRKRQELQ